MTDDSHLWTEKARRDLSAAERDLGAEDPENALARAYYAAFHAAVGALNADGAAARTHSGVKALFAERFAATGRFERETARTLAVLQQQREAADYGVGVPISAEAARTSVDRAHAFVAAVEALLGA